jgi:hypothetical protein
MGKTFQALETNAAPKPLSQRLWDAYVRWRERRRWQREELRAAAKARADERKHNKRWRYTGDAKRAVSVLVIHGMGQNDIGYSEAFREKVSFKIGKPKCHAVDWQEVYWADITRNNQTNYLHNADASSSLGWGYVRRIREFVVKALGDASAYQKVDDVGNTTYPRVQERLRSCIATLATETDPDRPLVIIAHSLGGHIASTFIHDTQKLVRHGDKGDELSLEDQMIFDGIKDSPFNRLETLTAILTVGCNIPLFTFAFGRARIFPITFPDKNLERIGVNKFRTWLNFYSPNDPLGYPCAPTKRTCVTGKTKR